METIRSPRWRSWLLLTVCSFSALAALSFAVVLFSGGSFSFVYNVPDTQPLSIINLAWINLAAAGVCIPGIVLAVRELYGEPLRLRPVNGFRLASLALVVWALLVAVFNYIETSAAAIYLLPPLILLVTTLPLWWYVEYARRGLPDRQPSRLWGLAGFSSAVTMPLVLVVSALVLVVVFILVGVGISADPALQVQLERFMLQMQSPNMDSDTLALMANQWMQNPLVIAGVLAVIAGILPLVEELFKTLAVWLYAGDRLTAAEGFMAGLMCGGSFALWENLSVMSSVGDGSGTMTLLVRVGTGLLHITTAGLVGWGIASAVQNKRGLPRLAGAYVVSGLLHCTWNAASVFVGVGGTLMPTPEALFSANWVTTAAFGVLGLLFVVNLTILTVMNRRLRPAAERPAPPAPLSSDELSADA